MIFNCEWCGKKTFQPGKRKRHRRFCGYPCKTDANRRRIDNPLKYASSHGYIYVKYWIDEEKKYRVTFEHRLIWERVNGPVPDGFVIHHINEIKTDNRLDNLALMLNAKHTSLHNRRLDLYPDKPTGADYARAWRKKHPEHKIKHMLRERARRARKRAERLGLPPPPN